MKKRQLHTPFVTLDLVTQFRLNPGSMRELVVQVALGLHPTLTARDLIDKVLRALQFEFKAAYEETNNHNVPYGRQHQHLLNTRILTQYVYELNRGPEIEDSGVKLPEEGISIHLHADFIVRAGRLDAEDLAAANEVLKQIDPHDRASFGLPIVGGNVLDLFPWYYGASSDFAVLLVLDGGGKAKAIAAIARDHQFRHVGNISIGLVKSCCDLGLREELLRILVQLAENRFGTIQEEVHGLHSAAIGAYQVMDFEQVEIPEDVPKAGERVSRFRFYRQLRTSEEYTSAGD